MIDLTLWMWIGFLLAAYSVIANDSVQTLGTWMASNRTVPKFYMWSAASAILVCTLFYGWYINDGDISYGRLNKIPFQEVQWYHALAPALLLVLTRIGVPVSTSFLVLSAFASAFVMEKMLLKSMAGYAVAAIAAYIMWYMVTYMSNKMPTGAVDESGKGLHHSKWVVAQWITTGLLWYTWLSHDMANIAVFLPRQLSLDLLIVVCAVFVIGLAFMFRENGGKIQKIIIEKSSTKYVRSATLIDAAYFVILYIFKEVNDIPMSTTWVFVGLLAGRELAIASHGTRTKIKNVFPLIGMDFLKMMIGLSASVAIVLLIHLVLNPQ